MRRLTLVLAVAACGLSLVGAAVAATSLRAPAAANGSLKYTKKTLSAPAGKVTITMPNPSPVPHNIAIKGAGVSVKGKVVGKGGTSTVSAKLKKGRYTFYCSVPGHEGAGMKGTLTVK